MFRIDPDTGSRTPRHELLQGPDGTPSTAGQVVRFAAAEPGRYDALLEVGDNDADGSMASAPAVVTVLAGLLMISNYRYFSFKEMHFKGTVPYVVFLLLVVLLVLIAQNPHETLLTMCVLYALSGPVLWIYRRQGRRTVPDRDPS